MAKNNYDSMIRMINEITQRGRDRGLGGLYTKNDLLLGRHVNIHNRTYIHFGSCSYLGLELDARLKQGAIDAINRYGTYFSCSRTYIANGSYIEFEKNLSDIFGTNIITYPKTSQGHQSVMPILIGDKDIVIYDQQAHISMHEVSYKLRYNGTEITILRHNNIEDLEKKINEYKSKYDKIWYVIDGVYSMFGDYPNYEMIVELMSRYKQLYLYVDDAHGMSWTGPNGSGYTLSKIKLNDRIVLATSLAKGFGSCGGVFAIKNKEMYDKVIGWGSSYTYSGPMEPATIGACIASSKIHLSNEINILQNKIKDRIDYCYQIFANKGLPLISSAGSPIFFVGLGTTSMGYNMIKRVMDDGYYTNLGIYPAVPESCTGLRFTLTNHLKLEDIEGLANSIARNLPLALKDEGRSMKDIIRAFRKYADLESRVANFEILSSPKVENNCLELKTFSSISQINSIDWDNLMEGKGAFNSNALKLYEMAFANNIDKHSNWKFIYYIISINKKILLTTFFTVALNKDDMLSNKNVSQAIEEIRKTQPDYLVSTSLMMGCQVTNGEHLYIDYSSNYWQEAVKLLISDLWLKQEEHHANMLLIRDIKDNQPQLNEVITDMGLAKIELPLNNIIYAPEPNSKVFFEKFLNKKQRYKIKNEVLDEIGEFSIKIDNCDETELKACYDLYLQTKKRSLNLNTFDLPYKLFELANNDNEWEFVRVYYKNELTPVSFGLCSKFKNQYHTFVFGMNYIENDTRNIYKKTQYLVVKHALECGCNVIHMGITAEQTKYMFGATKIKQLGYGIMKENYNALLLNNME